MGEMTPDKGVFKRKGSDVWQHRVYIPKDRPVAGYALLHSRGAKQPKNDLHQFQVLNAWPDSRQAENDWEFRCRPSTCTWESYCPLSERMALRSSWQGSTASRWSRSIQFLVAPP
jgi:hypothetical protein